jgi:hypothetical protein
MLRWITRWCNSKLYGTPLSFNCYVFVCSDAISPNLVVSHSIKLIFTVGPAIGWLGNFIWSRRSRLGGHEFYLSYMPRWRRIIISSGCDDRSMLDKLYQVRWPFYAASIHVLGSCRHHNRIWMDASHRDDATPNWTNVTRHFQFFDWKNAHAIACGPPASNFCRRICDLRRSCVDWCDCLILVHFSFSIWCWRACSGTRLTSCLWCECAR